MNLSNFLSITSLPTGAVMPFANNSVPVGWLAANGSAISRVAYSNLFLAIGVTYGVGNGSTTFNLPDLRGYFVRGSGTNSDGTVSGAFGVKQADATKAHTHSLSLYDSGNSLGQEGIGTGTNRLGTVSYYYSDWFGTLTTTSTGDTESRPKNIALLYCIKF